MQNEKTFDAGEVTLNYFEGAANGSPLVLLHGLTGSWQAWYNLIPELTKRWHVYAPDLRGHGKSDRAPDDHYRNADYARDVIAFLKNIGEPVVLMGHSLGAMVSIVTASRYPEGLRGVALLDPPLYTYTDTPYLQTDTTDYFAWVASIHRDQLPFAQVVAHLRAQMPGLDEQMVQARADTLAKVAPGTVETVLREELWQGVDLPSALRQITCPTLMIHGDWDHAAAVREQDVAFFKANCPAAVVARVPGATHMIPQEHPDVVLRELNVLFASS